MGSSVPVRCPACRRDHAYVPPVFPCACGAPLAPPLLRGARPQPITHRTWTDSWVTVRCPSCGRQDQWPQPELGCGCGTVLRIPVRPAPSVPPTGPLRAASAAHPGCVDASSPDLPPGSGPAADSGVPSDPGLPPDPGFFPARGLTPGSGASSGSDLTPGSGLAPGSDLPPDSGSSPDPDLPPGSGPSPGSDRTPGSGLPPGAGAEPSADDRPASGGQPGHGSRTGRPRPPFRPLTIRTARDAVTAAAVYLKWLGFRGILQSPEHPASGIDLRAPGLVAQVDPRTEPSTLRDVECLWLHGLNASAVSVFFSLTGYVPEARARAANLGVPLFVMDLTGTPQPANDAADRLVRTGG